jgi:hypothetical protein
MNDDLFNEIDGKLQDIKYMAEFAAELIDSLDGAGAKEGYFHIPQDQGNRLAFCCNDLLLRIGELSDRLRSSNG